MNAPAAAPVADEKSPPVRAALEESPAQIEDDIERAKSSLARLGSNSVDKLDELMSEIQEMREFLRSEGERVHREILNYAQLSRERRTCCNQDQSRDRWHLEKQRGRWRGAFWCKATFQRAREAQTLARSIAASSQKRSAAAAVLINHLKEFGDGVVVIGGPLERWRAR